MAHDEVDGQSLGFVDEYHLQGNLVARDGAARAVERALGAGDGAASATGRSTPTGTATAAGTTTARCGRPTATSS